MKSQLENEYEVTFKVKKGKRILLKEFYIKYDWFKVLFNVLFYKKLGIDFLLKLVNHRISVLNSESEIKIGKIYKMSVGDFHKLCIATFYYSLHTEIKSPNPTTDSIINQTEKLYNYLVSRTNYTHIKTLKIKF
jgi:hypothetical protein